MSREFELRGLLFFAVSLFGCTEAPEAEPRPSDDPDDPVACVAEPEVPYDGLDQDCSGEDLVDVDGDGADAVEAGGDDCDDDSPLVHPDAEDLPFDGVDQDCVDGDLVAPVWSLNLQRGAWSDELRTLIRAVEGFDARLLLEVAAEGDTDEVRLRVASTWQGEQDPCRVTGETAGTLDGFHTVTGGPLDVATTLEGGVLQLLAVELEATVDGTALVGGSLRGHADTREVSVAMGYDPLTLCQLIATGDLACEACPGSGDGDDPTCLRFEVGELSAAELSHIGAVVPRSQADVDADPACEGR